MKQTAAAREALEAHRVERAIPQFRAEGQRRLFDKTTDYRGVWVDLRGQLHTCAQGNPDHWHESKQAALNHAMAVWQTSRA